MTKEKSITQLQKQISEQSDDYSPPPISLSKMDSTLSEEDQISYKTKLTSIFKYYLAEEELDEKEFKKI